VDVDALGDGTDFVVAAVMEHIEEAGIHSGDSSCVIPPYALGDDLVARIKEQTLALARALRVRGLLNVQFAVRGDRIYLIEANPRASRTVPFVAKAIDWPLARLAALVIGGKSLKELGVTAAPEPKLVSIKKPVLPFARFPGEDALLGPEMKSTGEVMGRDVDFGRAFAKAQLGAGVDLPTKGTVFISVKDRDKSAMIEIGRNLVAMGFSLIATGGTQRFLEAEGLPITRINKVLEGRPHVVDAMKNGRVQLVFNTTEGAAAIADSASIRQSALLGNIPYYTTVSGARAAVAAIAALASGPLEVAPLQSYFKRGF
jgi:carbamoyl-phosphate synthase large subunit